MTDSPAGACVAFDVDGVIVASEPLWVVPARISSARAGGRWLPEEETAMMGISVLAQGPTTPRPSTPRPSTKES